MALTKSDLQAIKHIFRDETKSLKYDVKDLKIGLRKLELDLNRIENKLQKGQKRIETKLDKSFDYLDKNDLTLLTGLNKVENNLGFPATKI